jgi:hypothetical protein
MVCDECNGTGINKDNSWFCDKCKGKKELDWIENIIGVSEDIIDALHKTITSKEFLKLEAKK